MVLNVFKGVQSRPMVLEVLGGPEQARGGVRGAGPVQALTNSNAIGYAVSWTPHAPVSGWTGSSST